MEDRPPDRENFRTYTVHYTLGADGSGRFTTESGTNTSQPTPNVTTTGTTAGETAGEGNSRSEPSDQTTGQPPRTGASFFEGRPGYTNARLASSNPGYGLVLHFSADGSRPMEDTLRMLLAYYVGGEAVIPQKASARAIRSLKKLNLADVPQDEQNCTVCYEPFTPPLQGPEVKVEDDEDADADLEINPDDHCPVAMPCGHIFGLSCLRAWLNNMPSCPLCRKHIEGENQRPQTSGESPFRYPVVAHLLLHDADPLRHIHVHRAQSQSMAQVVDFVRRNREARERAGRADVPSTTTPDVGLGELSANDRSENSDGPHDPEADASAIRRLRTALGIQRTRLRNVTPPPVPEQSQPENEVNADERLRLPTPDQSIISLNHDLHGEIILDSIPSDSTTTASVPSSTNASAPSSPRPLVRLRRGPYGEIFLEDDTNDDTNDDVSTLTSPYIQEDSISGARVNPSRASATRTASGALRRGPRTETPPSSRGHPYQRNP